MKLSLETRQKISESMKGSRNPNFGKLGKNSVRWKKNGSYSYYHTQARKLYLKDSCDICGITKQERTSNQNMDLHCVDGNWRNLSRDNWDCCCRSCHKTIHNRNEAN